MNGRRGIPAMPLSATGFLYDSSLSFPFIFTKIRDIVINRKNKKTPDQAGVWII